MNTFPLKIVTPDGIRFDGEAQELIVRTTSGDTGILAGHMNYVAPLGMGRATIVTEGETRYGACIGGMVSVVKGSVTLVPTTFEWADQIDVDRAKASQSRALRFWTTKPPPIPTSCWQKPASCVLWSAPPSPEPTNAKNMPAVLVTAGIFCGFIAKTAYHTTKTIHCLQKY